MRRGLTVTVAPLRTIRCIRTVAHMPAAPSARPWIERLLANPAVRGGYASAVAHVIVLILLALLLTPASPGPRDAPLVLVLADEASPPAEEPGHPALNEPPVTIVAADQAAVLPPAPASDAAVHLPEPLAEALVAIPEAAPAAEPMEDATAPRARPASLSNSAPPARSALPEGAFSTRQGEARRRAARERGGSAASEAAVERGLAWLALHQGADGAWRFDLSNCRCAGACSHAGSITSTTAATGIALLPFLGAGHTHLDGPHQETVSRAIYSLIGRLQPTPRGGDLTEGTMYGQGVATLALAEALALTRDEMLVRPVTDAVKFIVASQDHYGGGWRYLPGQAGDTTVTAWQLAALKSAALAGLEVPTPTFDGVCRFLDRVQTRGGERYGYLGPQAKPCTSAIGLFCRLHTGWDQRATLDRGLATLARPGPDPAAVYQNFYLAQALLQADHPSWPRWNARNRDQLVAQQAHGGHELGSWFFADRETAPGGRLAHTALAVLTLEVYYRLLPLYRPEAVDRGL
ncbi:MAG: hypothetical protein ACKOOF_11480 [Planctomycetaceae bacterium]